MRLFSSLIVCLVLATSLAAQQYPKVIKRAPTTCPNDPVLPTDGRESQWDQIFFQEQFFTINVKGGHSYSVEVWDTFDATVMLSPTIQVLQGDCVTPVPVTDTTAMEPDLHGGFARRVSWIQSADATYQLGLINPDPNNTYVFQIRVTDTTLHSPRWSTVAGFSTHYGFLNNTSIDISGVLTLTSITPPQTYSTPLTIPAHNEAFVSIPSDILKVPVNQYGFADFEFTGAPGAITADGYFQAVSNGVFSIAPTTFAAPNFQH